MTLRTVVSSIPAAWLDTRNGVYGFHALIDVTRIYRPRYALPGLLPRKRKFHP